MQRSLSSGPEQPKTLICVQDLQRQIGMRIRGPPWTESVPPVLSNSAWTAWWCLISSQTWSDGMIEKCDLALRCDFRLPVNIPVLMPLCMWDHKKGCFLKEQNLMLQVRGAIKINFRKNLGFWPNQRTPTPLSVSWAAKKRKKSLMFILHFRLF